MQEGVWEDSRKGIAQELKMILKNCSIILTKDQKEYHSDYQAEEYFMKKGYVALKSCYYYDLKHLNKKNLSKIYQNMPLKLCELFNLHRFLAKKGILAKFLELIKHRKGIPDLFVRKGDDFFFVEAKVNDALRKDQLAFLKAADRLGFKTALMYFC